MRTEFIQSIIDQIGAKSYLEIGVQHGYNFKEIQCKRKVGIDPADYGWDYLQVTSDDFFEECGEAFDVIFIDGLHHSEQVLKDFENSLACLNPNGVIILHDCNPTSKEMQEIPERHLPGWTGDVWRAWLNIRRFSSLSSICVDLDTGMGVVLLKRSLSSLDKTYEDILTMTYEDLDKKRKNLLNLRDENYFKNILRNLPKV